MKRKIFTFWDTENIPQPIIDNINNMRISFPEFEIKILNNNSIQEFNDEYPVLTKLFNIATIPSYKADIIRFLYLHKYGGLWIDSSLCFKKCNLKKLYDEAINKFDFCTIIIPDRQHKDMVLSPGVMLSKSKNRFVYETLKFIEKKSIEHYQKESIEQEYVEYNFYLFVAPFVWQEILVVNNEKILLNLNFEEGNVLQPNIQSFKDWGVGLLNWDKKYMHFYCWNMEHHHGQNFDKHWSQLQKRQKLFL